MLADLGAVLVAFALVAALVGFMVRVLGRLTAELERQWAELDRQREDSAAAAWSVREAVREDLDERLGSRL